MKKLFLLINWINWYFCCEIKRSIRDALPFEALMPSLPARRCEQTLIDTKPIHASLSRFRTVPILRAYFIGLLISTSPVSTIRAWQNYTQVCAKTSNTRITNLPTMRTFIGKSAFFQAFTIVTHLITLTNRRNYRARLLEVVLRLKANITLLSEVYLNILRCNSTVLFRE